LCLVGRPHRLRGRAWRGVRQRVIHLLVPAVHFWDDIDYT
jgi:hypothetical protein